MVNWDGIAFGSITRTRCQPGLTGNFLGTGVCPIKVPSIKTLAPSKLHVSVRYVFRLVRSGGSVFKISGLSNFLVSFLTFFLIDGFFNISFAHSNEWVYIHQ